MGLAGNRSNLLEDWTEPVNNPVTGCYTDTYKRKTLDQMRLGFLMWI